MIVGRHSCFVLKRGGLHPIPANASPNAIPAGVGYGPSQLQSAYELTAASASDGAGRTIAIVDAYDDPTAASDLAAYRSAAGLPAVPSFKKVNQNGATSPLPSEAPADDDWTLEESLDLDMASAICPLCNIVLVEATNDSGTGLYWPRTPPRAWPATSPTPGAGPSRPRTPRSTPRTSTTRAT